MASHAPDTTRALRWIMEWRDAQRERGELLGQISDTMQKREALMPVITTRVGAVGGRHGIGDATGEAAARLVDVIGADLRRIAGHLERVEGHLAALQSVWEAITPQHRQILTLRVLEKRSWTYIGGRLHFSERQCQRILKAALVEIERLIGDAEADVLGDGMIPVSTAP